MKNHNISNDKSTVVIAIEHDIIRQLSEQLNSEEKDSSLLLNPSIGEGTINYIQFPNSLQFIHFCFVSNRKLRLHCINSANSEYFLLKINLSNRSVTKFVNGQEVDVQKLLPSGIIYYPPNTEVTTSSDSNTTFNIVLIKFKRNLLSSYFNKGEDVFLDLKDTLVHEDLDFKSEELLQGIINGVNKIRAHSNLLSFLAIFFDKLKRRKTEFKFLNIHPQDNKSIFLAASMLRDPNAKKIPSNSQLASIANMGTTKFKTIFKQVFGSSPKRYHKKIKMDYAKDQLQTSKKAIMEISFELGYTHPSKFSRAFKNHFGESPTKVR